MFIGIDLGTSAVKLVIVDAADAVVASAERPLAPARPRPLWSEDAPEAWWAAVASALDELAAAVPAAMAAVEGIGFSGQMHAPVLLDAAGDPIGPAILWNDGRSAAEAAEIALAHPALASVVGIPPMAGFAGPKLLWLRRHDPARLDKVRHLVSPKDFIRLRLTGVVATDVSDAAGTWLLDEEARGWSAAAAAACGADPAWLPPLLEATDAAGLLLPDLAKRWGMGARVTVAAGAGDTPAGGIAIGAAEEGQGFVSLGTSAQVFLAGDHYRGDPARLVHAFCHALPGRWYRMAALLNGASTLAGAAQWLGGREIGGLLTEVEAGFAGPSRLLALPYLSGERTPHDDPWARGAVVGLTADTAPREIAQAVLEGVAFSLADGLAALAGKGARPEVLGFIGGGSRSDFWGRIIASVLGVTLRRYGGAQLGPAFGAARLARLAAWGEAPATVVTPPPVQDEIAPDARLAEAYARRLPLFRSLYQALRPEFARMGG